MRRMKEGQTYEIKNRMRPSGCPKCGRRIMDVSLDTKIRLWFTCLFRKKAKEYQRFIPLALLLYIFLVLFLL